MQPEWFSQTLLNWHAQHGRHDLPWKKNLHPYPVWVSEIMLQQTQVTTVIPYFKRFIKAFPTIHNLAKASLDEVLQYWAGLGYYARGRNLHKTAQCLVTDFQGQFPQDVDSLMALPGIGRSTAGAILAQSFNIRAPILDGNVKRVLSRFHCVPGWYGEKSVENKLWELSEKYTPFKHIAVYTQAMMDLGATVCIRTQPLCEQCPLQLRCQAYLENKQDLFPNKKPTLQLPTRNVYMLLLITTKQQVLLQQRPAKGIWGGLWSLPEFTSVAKAKNFIFKNLKQKSLSLEPLLAFKHTFTHFHLNIHPLMAKVNQSLTPDNFVWVGSKELKRKGLPAPVKKLLRTFV